MIGDGSASAIAIEESFERRKVPCICPRQHEKSPPIGISTDLSISRGVIIETVKCSSCDRRWKRANV